MAVQGNRNTEVKIIAPKQIFPDVRGIVSSAMSNWYQGDILCFDTANSIVRACTAEADADNVLGIAQQAVSAGIPTGPYGSIVNQSNVGAMAVNGPVYGNTYNMYLKTSDSIAPGAYVYPYPSGDSTYKNYVAATAASTATKPIGVYVGHVTVSSAAAGTQIECLIGAQYPNTVLKF